MLFLPLSDSDPVEFDHSMRCLHKIWVVFSIVARDVLRKYLVVELERFTEIALLLVYYPCVEVDLCDLLLISSLYVQAFFHSRPGLVIILLL